MEKIKTKKLILIISLVTLIIFAMILGYYGVFIHPTKQNENQQKIISTLEKELQLNIPETIYLHSGSKMEYIINYVGFDFCQINIIGSFDKKEYNNFKKDLEKWEISGGYRSKSDIEKIRPTYYNYWKNLQSQGNKEYDYFIRMVEAKTFHGVHNQAVMLIEDKENDIYNLHLTTQIDIPKGFDKHQSPIKLYYEFGRPVADPDMLRYLYQ